MEESLLAVLATLVVSSSVGLISLSVQCSVQADCLKRGDCVEVDSWTCSFTSVVDEAGQVLFAGNDAVSDLKTATRGVCPPGEAQSLVDDQLACTRLRFYPNALNLEAVSPGEQEPHRRYCGAWIDSQSQYAVEPIPFAFYDKSLIDHQVAEAVVSKFKVRTDSSSPSRFRSACVRMVTSNSAGTEARLAFEWLMQKMETSSRTAVLRSVGVLASHYCDAPAQIALTFGSGYRELAFNISGGTTLADGDVLTDLYALGVDAEVRRMASGFAARILGEEPGGVADVGEVMHGIQGRWVSGDLLHLSRLLKAYEHDPDGASAYFQALAARCAFAVRESVFGASSEAARTGLDKLPPNDRFVAVGAAQLQAATSSTLRNAHARRHLVRATRRQGVSACNDAVATFFPGHVDEAVFETMVSPKLYERIGAAYPGVRSAVAAAIRGSIIAPTLGDPEAVARAALEVDMRVAGAPLDSWGGKFLPLPAPAFSSDDGSLLMLLKAAGALFDRRSRLVHEGGVCDLPALYSAATRNAYLFPAARCGMLLPGLLVPPFGDGLYDDSSLYSRIMYVVAHEVAHVTAYVSWRASAMADLLRGYPSSTHVEAIADLAAVNAIMLSGKVNSSELCAHVSQLWCAKMPDSGILGWLVGLSPGSHPELNKRGDLMCSFLERNF